MDCTIYVAKTKALISCAVTAHLIWVFVFSKVKSRFSHDAIQLIKWYLKTINNIIFFSIFRTGKNSKNFTDLRTEKSSSRTFEKKIISSDQKNTTKLSLFS